MTRLADLRPAWRRIYRDHHLTPDNGGFPTDNYELSFQCPLCGPPGRVTIAVGPSVQTDPRRIWMAIPCPDGPDWPKRVTITPSINNTTSGHSHTRSCGWHGNIVNGEVLP